MTNKAELCMARIVLTHVLELVETASELVEDAIASEPLDIPDQARGDRGAVPPALELRPMREQLGEMRPDETLGFVGCTVTRLGTGDMWRVASADNDTYRDLSHLDMVLLAIQDCRMKLVPCE